MKFYLKVIALLLGINVSGQTLLHTNGRAIVNTNGDSVILKTMNLYKKDNILKIRDKYVYMKENGLNKAAKRVVSIANSNRLRNKEIDK